MVDQASSRNAKKLQRCLNLGDRVLLESVRLRISWHSQHPQRVQKILFSREKNIKIKPFLPGRHLREALTYDKGMKD
jgi:hypothetical protein